MSEEKKITVHNKISANFREIHVDGAYGGATARGLLNLSFYAERAPIPKSTVFEINENNSLGKPLENSEDSKSGILREYEFGVYMDISVAKSIVKLLSEKIQQIESTYTNNNADAHK